VALRDKVIVSRVGKGKLEMEVTAAGGTVDWEYIQPFVIVAEKTRKGKVKARMAVHENQVATIEFSGKPM